MAAIDIYPMGNSILLKKTNSILQEILNSYFWKRSAYESLTSSIFDYIKSANVVFDELSSIEHASSLRASYDVQL